MNEVTPEALLIERLNENVGAHDCWGYCLPCELEGAAAETIARLTAGLAEVRAERDTANNALLIIRTIADRHNCAAGFVDDCVQQMSVKLTAAEASAREAWEALEPFAKAGEQIADGRGVWVEKPFDGQIDKADFARAAAAYAGLRAKVGV